MATTEETVLQASPTAGEDDDRHADGEGGNTASYRPSIVYSIAT